MDTSVTSVSGVRDYLRRTSRRRAVTDAMVESGEVGAAAVVRTDAAAVRAAAGAAATGSTSGDGLGGGLLRK